MFLCEHFIYALFNTYRIIKSPGVDKLLSRRNIAFLCDRCDVDQEIVLQAWFPEEKVLTVSSIHPVVDGYGRSGVWNHTILIRIEDYLQLTQPQNIFKSYFIRELKVVPDKLDLIKIGG